MLVRVQSWAPLFKLLASFKFKIFMFLVEGENNLADESTKKSEYSQKTSTNHITNDYHFPLSINEIRAAKQFHEDMYLLSEGAFKPTINEFVEHDRKHTKTGLLRWLDYI